MKMLGYLALLVAALATGWGGWSIGKAVADRWKPRGKGVFFRRLTQWGSAEQTAAKIKADNIGWVLLIGDSWHKNMANNYFPDKIGEYAKAIQDAGADVWLWGWVDPASEHFADWPAHYGKLAREIGAKGVLLNAEAPWQNKKWNASAKWLVDALHAEGLRVMLSSYGQKSQHPHFAWEGFAGADAGAPMIYDFKNKQKQGFAKTAMRQWSEMFDVVVPVWGMSSGNNQTMAAEIKLANSTPITSGAVAVWDAYWLQHKNDRGQWYASYEVPKKSDGTAIA